MPQMLQPVLGILALLGLAWAFSENRRAVTWRPVALGLGLQLVLAFLLLRVPASQEIFLALNSLVLALQEATQEGTSFVFGYLGGGELPFEEKPGASSYILAFQGLPLVLVASALSSLLFYWRVLPLLVRGFSYILQKTLGVGGAEGVAAAANIFLGMVEAPLFVKQYLQRLQRGELFLLMATGMATIAGTVLVLYASILQPVLPQAMGHLLVASILSAPAAVAISRIMVPVQKGDLTGAELGEASSAGSSMEAVTNGTLQGAKLLINILALLVVLVALVSLANQILGLLPAVQSEPLTLQRILGWILAPLVWLLGVPWQESTTAGSLLGTKTVLNELLAYTELSRLGPEEISERTRLIMSYALCGFANPGSLGIMLGGLGGLAPERRQEIVQLGLKSIVAGTLATCMTGAVVALVAAQA
ncbi:MAG: nucleoside transporter C-terminal domain-containing protein [Desulfohalobiaceae bacterium]